MKQLNAAARQLAPALRVALAGNPNSGKTTLFNGLTGGRQRVANYPGVTVERRTGLTRVAGARCELVDLPGTYSLTAWSPEERVARTELLSRAHDVVVVVVDATTLQRSLVLLAQVLQLGVKVVLCLNMADEASRAGLVVDLDETSELLGVPVVETVGHRGLGLDELRSAIHRAAAGPVPSLDPRDLDEGLAEAVAAIEGPLAGAGFSPTHRSWAALRLLCDDREVVDQVARAGAASAVMAAQRERLRLEAAVDTDVHTYVAGRYHDWVAEILAKVVRAPLRPDARAASDRVDAVLVHPVLGLPLFALVMYAVFWLTFTLGEVPMAWLEDSVAALAGAVAALWPDGSTSLLQSLLVDGVIGGVGAVVVFVPNIVLLFLGLAFLEDSGYMARAAFLMDRVMHRFSLHGRSFLPMMTGFGCSIPGIMATRTLDNERDRLTTMLVLPLMSCGARLPIWMLLIPALFPSTWQAPMLFGVYATGIALALVVAAVLQRTLLRGEEAPFVMELPPYRLPTPRAVVTKVAERAWVYLRKAGTVILALSVLLWCLTVFPKPDTYAIDEAIAAGHARVAAVAELEVARAAAPVGVEVLTEAEVEHRRAAEGLAHSMAGRMGRFMEPAIAPLGFDWKLGTALIGAFAAKEVFVSQMGIVYSLGESDETSDGLRATLASAYGPLVGLSLILFLLISAPCMATVAITRRESGSWRWALLQLGGLTILGYAVALVVFQVGSLVT